MGIGAFAGGVVKGLHAVNDMVNTNRRTAIAEEDAALRKRASDREETRYQRELSEQAKRDKLEAELAENVNLVFGKPATPDTTETLTGPLDAKDARAGTMDGVQTQVNVPGQPATGAGGMQGVNLLDPSNHGKLFQLEALNMASRMRNGGVKPDEVQRYVAWGKQMEKDGSADAFRKFMLGDTSALDEMAKKNGIRAYSTAFETDEDGSPQLMFKAEREDGTIQTLPAAIFATGIGAMDMAGTMNQVEDNRARAMQLRNQHNYQNAMLAQGDRRIAIEDKRAGQSAALQARRLGLDERQIAVAERGAGANETRAQAALIRANKYGTAKAGEKEGYDLKLIPELVDKTPPYMPQIGKVKSYDKDATPEKDHDAIEDIVRLANRDYSRGKDPVESEAAAREAVRKAGDAAMKQLGDKASKAEFLRLRREFIRKAEAAAEAKRAKPAESDTLRVAPDTQKARDTDKVSILRAERQSVAAKLEKATDPDERHRLTKDLEALDRELGNGVKVASAIRRK